MITLDPVTPQNAMLFKQVRLQALRDTPKAFSSTYADESRLTDAEWVKRASLRNGEGSIVYLAMDAITPCGIVGGFLDKDDASRAHLVSMWVAPVHRRLGIGRKLVEAIFDWARAQRARSVQLIVTSNNEAAIEFYKRQGFTLTGHTAPYRNDPTLNDLEMNCSISQP
jgi:ribosomal protein S18 acetylase RimI-like enzyme